MSGCDAALDELRLRGTIASRAGAPFLLVFGCAWVAAAVLDRFVGAETAPWIYLFIGVPAAPIAIALDRRWASQPMARTDPLLPLCLRLLFVQVLAFPATLLAWEGSPRFVAVAQAAIVGAHLLPFQWIYRARFYVVLAFVVALGPYTLALVGGPDGARWSGMVVGLSLLFGGRAASVHASAVARGVRASSCSIGVPASLAGRRSALAERAYGVSYGTEPDQAPADPDSKSSA